MSPDPKETAKDAVLDRMSGEQPGRMRALVAAAAAGVAAAALTYRFLRSDPGPDYDY